MCKLLKEFLQSHMAFSLPWSTKEKFLEEILAAVFHIMRNVESIKLQNDKSSSIKVS